MPRTRVAKFVVEDRNGSQRSPRTSLPPRAVDALALTENRLNAPGSRRRQPDGTVFTPAWRPRAGWLTGNTALTAPTPRARSSFTPSMRPGREERLFGRPRARSQFPAVAASPRGEDVTQRHVRIQVVKVSSLPTPLGMRAVRPHSPIGTLCHHASRLVPIRNVPRVIDRSSARVPQTLPRWLRSTGSRCDTNG